MYRNVAVGKGEDGRYEVLNEESTIKGVPGEQVKTMGMEAAIKHIIRILS